MFSPHAMGERAVNHAGLCFFVFFYSPHTTPAGVDLYFLKVQPLMHQALVLRCLYPSVNTLVSKLSCSSVLNFLYAGAPMPLYFSYRLAKLQLFDLN